MGHFGRPLSDRRAGFAGTLKPSLERTPGLQRILTPNHEDTGRFCENLFVLKIPFIMAVASPLNFGPSRPAPEMLVRPSALDRPPVCWPARVF